MSAVNNEVFARTDIKTDERRQRLSQYVTDPKIANALWDAERRIDLTPCERLAADEKIAGLLDNVFQKNPLGYLQLINDIVDAMDGGALTRPGLYTPGGAFNAAQQHFHEKAVGLAKDHPVESLPVLGRMHFHNSSNATIPEALLTAIESSPTTTPNRIPFAQHVRHWANTYRTREIDGVERTVKPAEDIYLRTGRILGIVGTGIELAAKPKVPVVT